MLLLELCYFCSVKKWINLIAITFLLAVVSNVGAVFVSTFFAIDEQEISSKLNEEDNESDSETDLKLTDELATGFLLTTRLSENSIFSTNTFNIQMCCFTHATNYSFLYQSTIDYPPENIC